MTKVQLVVVPYDWARSAPPEPFDPAAYAAALPDASGEFTGTFDSDLVRELFEPPEFFAVEIDTRDQPNALAGAQAGFVITLDTWGSTITMTVDHVEVLDGNLVRAWVRSDSVTTIHKDRDE